MKSLPIVWWAALLASACTTEEERRAAELEADQGPCEDLERATCQMDARCQQTFQDSGWQPEPFVTECLRLRSGAITAAGCSTLSYDACRARADCSLMYWQDLGPDDSPVGDPYFKKCVTES